MKNGESRTTSSEDKKNWENFEECEIRKKLVWLIT